MNDEANKEVATLMFRASKLTAEALAEAMEKFNKAMEDRKKELKEAHREVKPIKEKKPKVKHGKMTLKKLLEQNQGAVNIEVPRNGVDDFVRIAKKYHVDFAIKKSNNTKPPTYMCFFKARDSDVLSAAFKEYIRYENKKSKGPRFKQVLKEAREEANKKKEKRRDKQRDKQKEKTRSRQREEIR